MPIDNPRSLPGASSRLITDVYTLRRKSGRPDAASVFSTTSMITKAIPTSAVKTGATGKSPSTGADCSKTYSAKINSEIDMYMTPLRYVTSTVYNHLIKPIKKALATAAKAFMFV